MGEIVSLALFRIDAPYKPFTKYLEGLKDWPELARRFFPGFGLQLFVDDNILRDPVVRPYLDSAEARDAFDVWRFECPEVLEKNGFHRGLFASMVRFFPIVKFPGARPGPVAVFDVEPLRDDALLLSGAIKAVHGRKVDFMYYGPPNPHFPTRRYGDCVFPYVFAGRTVAFKRFPVRLLSEFIARIPELGRSARPYSGAAVTDDPYSYGIDEVFMNNWFLPKILEEGATVAYLEKFEITQLFYRHADKIRKDPRSLERLRYILSPFGRSAGAPRSVQEGIKRFDREFYGMKPGRPVTAAQRESARRFYEVLEKAGSWGIPFSRVRDFYGAILLVRVVVTRGGKITEVIPFEEIS